MVSGLARSRLFSMPESGACSFTFGFGTPPDGFNLGTRDLNATRPGEPAPSIDELADLSISRGLSAPQAVRQDFSLRKRPYSLAC
jgi:hypothetical protein